MKAASSINWQDALGGAILLVFGLILATYAMVNYDLGRLNQMGPGMFPTIVGWVLAGLGCIVIATAFFTTGAPVRWVRLRPLLFIVASIAVFALLIRPLGMLPSVAAAALVAILAEGRLSLVRSLALVIVLMLGAWLIFSVGLSTSMPLFRSPC